ncbi:TPA: NYN domain-containing protein [Vibrio parahaemolyticus]|uniref:NYN domain-containing protein n=1 Tax=Vibrio campbellii TaxID=680 RepID=UPI001F08608D|nr:NYN domain-containing protein [Vibrio campbellii]UMM06695.1 NYN domain-containing protein [Vibrio campbellii]
MSKTICLIDAENVSHRKVDAVIKHAKSKSDLIEIRIYGDFSRRSMKCWKHQTQKHRMVVVDQPGAVAGKNTSDISLVVDAMDLMYQRGHEFDGFALCTSDSDFAVLTRRIRKGGFTVDGYGEQKAPESFREACSNYYEEKEVEEENNRPTGLSGSYMKLLKLLKRAIQSCSDVGSGWVKMSDVGRALRSINPSVQYRDYGARRFADLFRNRNFAGQFRVRKVGDTLQVSVVV